MEANELTNGSSAWFQKSETPKLVPPLLELKTSYKDVGTMKNKIIIYSLEHIQGSRFQLEIIEGDRVTSYFGDLAECQKALSEELEVRFKKMRQTLFEPVKNLSSEFEEKINLIHKELEQLKRLIKSF